MGYGHHCTHYKDNGCSMARRHKGHSEGRRDWSAPCTAWRKGICNRIGSILLSFFLFFFAPRVYGRKKCTRFASDKLLLSEHLQISIKQFIKKLLFNPSAIHLAVLLPWVCARYQNNI